MPCSVELPMMDGSTIIHFAICNEISFVGALVDFHCHGG